MNQPRKLLIQMAVAAAGLSALIQPAQAQTFGYTNNDLFLGFRKTAAPQGTNEVVVDIGPATNYVKLTAGTTITVSGFSASQLSPDSFAGLTNLNWSAFGDVNNPYVPGYPAYTVWLTMPRSNPSVQTTPPTRQYQDPLQSVVLEIESIPLGAFHISGLIGVANPDNTVSFVREPVSLSPYDNLSSFLGGRTDATKGTLQDTWYDPNSLVLINIENTTPSSFTSAVRSDLYEIRPDGVLDPHTGQTSGDAYYVGYFQFNTDGTMTFTRAGGVQPPPQPQLSIARSGTNYTISFASANGATYSLYYTNSAGLKQPIATWPVLPTTITGDGTGKTFTNATSDPNRFYRVGAQ